MYIMNDPKIFSSSALEELMDRLLKRISDFGEKAVDNHHVGRGTKQSLYSLIEQIKNLRDNKDKSGFDDKNIQILNTIIDHMEHLSNNTCIGAISSFIREFASLLVKSKQLMINPPNKNNTPSQSNGSSKAAPTTSSRQQAHVTPSKTQAPTIASAVNAPPVTLHLNTENNSNNNNEFSNKQFEESVNDILETILSNMIVLKSSGSIEHPNVIEAAFLLEQMLCVDNHFNYDFDSGKFAFKDNSDATIELHKFAELMEDIKTNVGNEKFGEIIDVILGRIDEATKLRQQALTL